MMMRLSGYAPSWRGQGSHDTQLRVSSSVHRKRSQPAHRKWGILCQPPARLRGTVPGPFRGQFLQVAPECPLPCDSARAMAWRMLHDLGYTDAAW